MASRITSTSSSDEGDPLWPFEASITAILVMCVAFFCGFVIGRLDMNAEHTRLTLQIVHLQRMVDGATEQVNDQAHQIEVLETLTKDTQAKK
jgi:uncharacterized membrane-anchored protein YhcB (DUF1043 family)